MADKDSLTDKNVYAALFQTAGRGQKGNRWESRAGENLTFSILLKPEGIHVTEQFTISQVVALGIIDYLGLHGVKASVKWPNDIYAGDRKICGTLIENTLKDKSISASIAGIGLNMNQTVFDPSIPNPTSLSLETGKSFDVKEELPELLNCIYGYYDQLGSAYARNGFEAKYLEQLYRRGEWHFFEVLPASDIPAEYRSGLRIEARILGTDTESRLLLEHRDGTLHSYGFKEVKYVIQPRQEP